MEGERRQYRLLNTIPWDALDGQLVRIRCLSTALVAVVVDRQDVVELGRVVHRRPGGGLAESNGDGDPLKPAVDPDTWRDGAGEPLWTSTAPTEHDA